MPPRHVEKVEEEAGAVREEEEDMIEVRLPLSGETVVEEVVEDLEVDEVDLVEDRVD